MRKGEIVSVMNRKATERARAARCLACISVLLIVLFLGACASPQAVHQAAPAGLNVPRTQADFRDDPANFHFIIVSDNTEGHRPGVLRKALRQANMLEPAFVINIGDLIEGYSEDPAQLAAEWDEIDAAMSELDMPFFFVVGNHDMGNDVMLDVWHARRGRDYYHFVYKNVLFLALNTEDPPLPVTKDIAADVAKLRETLKIDRDKAYQMVMENKGLQRAILYPKIGNEQVEYFRQALANNPDVRWTFVLMHKPAWKYRNENFQKIEAMLQGRNYTVFAGHDHYYEHFDINGKDYIQLGTTGGHIRQEGPGAFDHIAVVNMTENGPKIVNLLVDGFRDRMGRPFAE
jgi:hypothetical protein